MRIFHLVAFNSSITSGQPVYTSPDLSRKFGAVDMLHVSGYATQATGSPSLTIQSQVSINGENWTGGNLFVNGLALSATETVFQGFDQDVDTLFFSAKCPFVRLVMQLSAGASAQAFVQLWVTGRDRSSIPLVTGSRRD
jgi:hypothetical protein